MSAAVSLNEARNEMRRLIRIMLQINKKYLDREKYVVRKHAEGHQNFSGDLSTVLNNDLILSNYSGGSKTCSLLAQGLAAYIMAEVALEERRTRTGLTPMDVLQG